MGDLRHIGEGEVVRPTREEAEEAIGNSFRAIHDANSAARKAFEQVELLEARIEQLEHQLTVAYVMIAEQAGD